MSSKTLEISLSILLSIILSTQARVLIVTDPKLESCTKHDKSTMNDLTEFELIPENDTTTFVNGSWKFNRRIESPWPMRIFAEHYIRGEWLVQAFDRHYKDMCEAIKNPIEPWYYATKNLKQCPLPAGTVWTFDMVPIQWSQTLLNALPRHYMGRWRISYDGQYKEPDGTVKHDCQRGYGDAFID